MIIFQRRDFEQNASDEKPKFLASRHLKMQVRLLLQIADHAALFLVAAAVLPPVTLALAAGVGLLVGSTACAATAPLPTPADSVVALPS